MDSGVVMAGVYAGYTIRNIRAVREHWRAISVVKLVGVSERYRLLRRGEEKRLLIEAPLETGAVIVQLLELE